MRGRSRTRRCGFQSTLLIRGATRRTASASPRQRIFQSTLLIRGATIFVSLYGFPLLYFNPRSSYEERQRAQDCGSFRRYFNPRSSYEERPFIKSRRVCFRTHISIHAPHTRSDYGAEGCPKKIGISIHAPHTRSDNLLGKGDIFYRHFNPRSSYEERLSLLGGRKTRSDSIHAPHTRSDGTGYF